MEKKGKKYSDYYKDDNFRIAQQAHLLEKIECECGKSMCRVSIYKHRETKNHAKRMESLTRIDTLEERRDNMIARRDKIEENIEEINKTIDRVKKKYGKKVEK
jgi:hypothetical protein